MIIAVDAAQNEGKAHRHLQAVMKEKQELASAGLTYAGMAESKVDAEDNDKSCLTEECASRQPPSWDGVSCRLVATAQSRKSCRK